jgi:hypothetical protein
MALLEVRNLSRHFCDLRKLADAARLVAKLR